MRRQNVSGARVALAPSTVGATHGARGAACNAWPAPRSSEPTRLSRPPTNSPARVAQRAHGGRAPRGPRFARFAAAMEAEAASQAQLLRRPQRRIRPADPVGSSARIQWLGIGSWALFCAALFVSLLLRPDRVSFQLDQIQPRALVSNVRSIAESTLRGLLPAHGQEAVSRSPATAPDLDATHADQGTRAGLEADLQ
jgi:hypothetical protein